MTAPPVSGAGTRIRLDTPADLQRLMGTNYQVSGQQWIAISAPLEPAVVIAGAGSGKTSVMAARVVYLVATGHVEADQVLGLDVDHQGHRRAGVPRPGSTCGRGPGRRPVRAAPRADKCRAGPRGTTSLPKRVEPMVVTYNAYAAALLSEHGLRIGHEPETRVMADASRYQVAARAIERHTGAVNLLSEHPKTAIDYLLALDAELNEHLVRSTRCGRSMRSSGRSSRQPWPRPAPRPTSTRPSGRWKSAKRCSTWFRATARSRSSSG